MNDKEGEDSNRMMSWQDTGVQKVLGAQVRDSSDITVGEDNSYKKQGDYDDDMRFKDEQEGQNPSFDDGNNRNQRGSSYHNKGTKAHFMKHSVARDRGISDDSDGGLGFDQKEENSYQLPSGSSKKNTFIDEDEDDEDR